MRPGANRALLVITCIVCVHTIAYAEKQAAITISLAAYTSTPSIGFSDGARSGTRIDAIWITMQELRFHPASSCNGATSPAIQGPITAELASHRATGLDDTAKLAIGRYCAFELSFRRSRGKIDEAPPDLRGASIVIVGKRGDGVGFLIRARLDSSPRLRALDVQGFGVTGPTRMILAADVGRWLRGVDLWTAGVTGDATRQEIRIDEHSNSELLAVFRANVEPGLGLFEDRDGNLSLDEAERTHPLATGQPAR